jgi:tripartite-type tricarboxylate transporter receptor subunit TctC
VAGDTRFAGFPDVPTSAELGYPLTIGTWRAIGMPKGTPPDIVAKIDAAIAEAVKDERFVAQMEQMNANIRYLGSDALLDYLKEQEAVYRKILN